MRLPTDLTEFKVLVGMSVLGLDPTDPAHPLEEASLTAAYEKSLVGKLRLRCIAEADALRDDESLAVSFDALDLLAERAIKYFAIDATDAGQVAIVQDLQHNLHDQLELLVRRQIKYPMWILWDVVRCNKSSDALRLLELLRRYCARE